MTAIILKSHQRAVFTSPSDTTFAPLGDEIETVGLNDFTPSSFAQTSSTFVL